MRVLIGLVNLIGAGLLLVGAIIAISTAPDAFTRIEVEPEDFSGRLVLGTFGLLLAILALLNASVLLLRRPTGGPVHALLAANGLCAFVLLLIAIAGASTNSLWAEEYLLVGVPLAVLLAGVYQILVERKRELSVPR